MTPAFGLELNAIYGALLSLRDGVDDAKKVEQWTALGGRTFLREARARDEGKEPVVLSFPNALPKEATVPLRTAGFRFNKVFQHWEGLAEFDEAQKLAGAHGGTAKRITPLPAASDKLNTAAE